MKTTMICDSAMNKERRYSAMYGLDYEVSVEGDGDCKKAYFNQPKNSYEENWWWALGVKEDADAIANLAVNMRDELRNCIVEMDRVKAINKELLEALEFCCTNNCERKLWYKQNRTTPPFDMPKEKCIDCPVMETIEKTKGLLNG